MYNSDMSKDIEPPCVIRGPIYEAVSPFHNAVQTCPFRTARDRSTWQIVSGKQLVCTHPEAVEIRFEHCEPAELMGTSNSDRTS